MSNGLHKTVRLPEMLLARLEAIAKDQGIQLSAVMRIALQRGVAALERDQAPASAPAQRRRILSRGVL